MNKEHMDRFLVRAWNKKTNTMIDLYTITPLALSAGLKGNGIYIPFDRNELILMQCTGLKDSEDKLIWEGDIVEVGDGSVSKVVRWDDEHASYFIHPELFIPWELTYKYKEIKVLGNIYENPELIKQNE